MGSSVQTWRPAIKTPSTVQTKIATDSSTDSEV